MADNASDIDMDDVPVNLGNEAGDIGDDPEFQEGCRFTKTDQLRPGRKRNWLTGYCRVPCPEGEQRHPVTGVCTTLDELREEEGVDLGRQFEYGAIERSIVDRSDKRDDFAPLVDPALGDANLPNNNYCPAGTRLNRPTGKCKKVPQCNRWEAVNPRTGRCATREYLKRQVTEQQPNGPFLYEGEDDLKRGNEKWSPSATTTIANRPGVFFDDMKNLIWASWLTVADLRTMRGVHEAGRIHGIQDDGQVDGDIDLDIQMIGIYSPPQRKKCENSTFTRFLVSDFYACGFRKVEIIPQDNNVHHIDDFIVQKGNDQDFIFIHKEINFDMMKQFLKATQRSQQNRKFIVVVPLGVWRVLVRYVQFDGPLQQHDQDIDAIDFDAGAPDPQIPDAVALYLDGILPNIWCVSWHEFDNETLV